MECESSRRHKGKFYVFKVQINGKWLNEVPDPYAKAVGVNGKRAMVVDLKTTNPVDWEKDKSPVFKNPTDAILYELHVRDASIAANSGIKNKGKYLGLTETETKNAEGLSTGLDHIKRIGSYTCSSSYLVLIFIQLMKANQTNQI